LGFEDHNGRSANGSLISISSPSENAKVIFMKLRTVAFLACWTLSGTGHSVILSAENQQPAGTQADTVKQTEPKSAPRPNPNADGIYHVGDGVTAPKLIYSVEPEFSEKARKLKISGNITVQLIVGTDGHVRDAHIIKSCAEKITNKKDHEAALQLDQQAMEAARQYRFEPAIFQGKPVPAELNVEINFQIF
jgi:TonB family protein